MPPLVFGYVITGICTNGVCQIYRQKTTTKALIMGFLSVAVCQDKFFIKCEGIYCHLMVSQKLRRHVSRLAEEHGSKNTGSLEGSKGLNVGLLVG